MTSVLFIDDHPIVSQGCHRMLLDMGVETLHEATNVVAGYRSFLGYCPDVIITDLTFHGDDLTAYRLSAASRPSTETRGSSSTIPRSRRALQNGAMQVAIRRTRASESAMDDLSSRKIQILSKLEIDSLTELIRFAVYNDSARLK